MKRIAPLLIAVALTSCARFNVRQSDVSRETSTNGVVQTREITLKLSGSAWFSSAQNINKLKATQTDKSQSFGTDSVTTKGDTNTLEKIKALTELIRAVP